MKPMSLVDLTLLAVAIPCLVVGADSLEGGPMQRSDGHAASRVRITVEASHVLGPVNRLVFGQNLEAGDVFGVFSARHESVLTDTGYGVWNPETAAPVPEVLRYAQSIGISALRYPGGCLVHGFDWKQSIGPIAKRPKFRFGLDEYLAYCQVLKATPLITVSDYTGTAQDAADLVEYLNAPADSRHPWAQKRAANGHPQPYEVRYFELGNESDHGNHDLKPTQKFSAETYAAWVNAYAAKMRAVDPSIRLSALMGTGTGPDDPWNDIVLARTKGSVDFIAIHTYAVALWDEGQVRPYPEGMLMRACMASADQFEDMLATYRTKIRRHTGRDLPLAITEYNAAMVQEKPVPYRFSFAAALFSADYLRVLLKPDANVLMANYWEFINGYWGMVKGPMHPYPAKERAWSVNPAFSLYQLWAQHFGQVLVGTEVRGSPRVELPQSVGVMLPAIGSTHEKSRATSENLLAGTTLNAASGVGYSVEVLPDAALRVTMKELTGACYLPIGRITAKPGLVYEMTLEARVTGEVGASVLGLGMIDMRGWAGPLTGTAIDTLGMARQWTPFSVRFTTPEACPGLDISLRLLSTNMPLSGLLEIRKLSVRTVTQERFPAYQVVTASASLAADGQTAYLMVFNKHETDTIPVDIDLRDFAAVSAAFWRVVSPTMAATNSPAGPSEWRADRENGGLEPGQLQSYLLPPCSMTAFEFRRK